MYIPQNNNQKGTIRMTNDNASDEVERSIDLLVNARDALMNDLNSESIPALEHALARSEKRVDEYKTSLAQARRRVQDYDRAIDVLRRQIERAEF